MPGVKQTLNKLNMLSGERRPTTFYNKNVEEEWTKCGFRYYHASRACVKRNNKLFNGQVIVEGAENGRQRQKNVVKQWNLC